MSKIDFEALVGSKDWEDRLKAARAGVGLETLVNDPQWVVRAAVAKQGYGLETLLHDQHWCVRATVAEQRHGLDVLVHDKEWAVRKAVAEQGYGLEILMKDPERFISDFAKKMKGIVPRVKFEGVPESRGLDEKLADASQRSCESKAGGLAGTRNSEFGIRERIRE